MYFLIEFRPKFRFRPKLILAVSVVHYYLVPNHTFLGRPWVFGQNKDTVLPAICHILDNVSYLKDAERGDPVKVRIVTNSLHFDF